MRLRTVDPLKPDQDKVVTENVLLLLLLQLVLLRFKGSAVFINDMKLSLTQLYIMLCDDMIDRMTAPD